MLMLVKSLYRRLRRRLLMMRYRNLEIEYGAVVTGRFTLQGNGSVFISEGSRLLNTRLTVEGALVIGKNCYLNGAAVVAMKRVNVGSDCLLSDVYITDSDFHNIEPELRHLPPTEKTTRPVSIGCNVWLGDRVVVLKGSVIGDHSVIGSNSVVRGYIPQRVVCIGNPVQVVKNL